MNLRAGIRGFIVLLTFSWVAGASPAGSPAAPAKPVLPPATHANVPYGPDPHQVLDFWQAPSARPTALVFYIHGGAWIRGDKFDVVALDRYLAAGISVVSINYRFVWDALQAKAQPPVQWPMRDAARALQFTRSRAPAWNIDPERIGAAGDSAGACLALWLAFHPDLVDPRSTDPIDRCSTRLACVGTTGAQTTLDPQQMKDWTPNSFYGGHAFGLLRQQVFNDMGDFDAFLRRRAELLPWIEEYSPYALASAAAPPVYLKYRVAPELGKPQADPTHTANVGVKLQEKLGALGVTCELVYPGAPNVTHPDVPDFMIATLARNSPPPKNAP